MPVIKIDISEVPADKLDHPDFLSLKASMEAALSQPQWVSAFCIHEAGHMTYFEQLGTTKFVFSGPRICPSGPDTFDGYMATVKPESIPAMVNVERFQENLNIAAKAYVAGHIFTKRLTGAPDTGAEEDRFNFSELCATVEKSAGSPPGTIDVSESWATAETEVLHDLRSPQFRRDAWATADKIRANLFGS
jgi:hypothetical protein